MSAAEYRAYLLQQSQKKVPKHRNRIVYVYEDAFASTEKGLTNHGKIVDAFGSVKEYNRWCELKLIEKAGRVTDLRRQVPFLLQEAFVSADGGTHKAINYYADFVYIREGKTVVEDVKGQDKHTGKHLTTATFRLKWKLLQAKYPDYVFELY